jgi:hypothetical protein
MSRFLDFIEECNKAPRLNPLAGFFSATAGGKSGVPLRRPLVDRRLLPADRLLIHLVELHANRQGHFDRHYHASIPYRLEEECRMAFALLKYARKRPSPLLLYSLGTAEGTMTRTLSELSGGQVTSLSCSPDAENLESFMAYVKPPSAEFFLGPFHTLTKDTLIAEKRLLQFSDGFDVILEDTTFQMYSPNRRGQIEFVVQHLKKDGIFLFLEKYRAIDGDDYARRERQKDFGFKSRYFEPEDIERKKDLVLTTMFNSEVSLAEMHEVVKTQFLHCSITWNSGNSYGLAASNSRENLLLYLSEMAAPAIPIEYVYERALAPDVSSWVAPALGPDRP